MATHRTTRTRAAFLGAVCLAVSACGAQEAPQPRSYAEIPPDRFEIIPVPGTQEVIQLDTGSGRTWRLTWSVDEDGNTYASGWDSLDRPDFPLELTP